jgi:hypothetical protein
MLDCDDGVAASGFDWESAEPKTVLSSELAKYFNRRGHGAVRPDCRRSRVRVYMHSKAVLCHADGSRWGVYAADVSGVGIRLLAPHQLYPGDCYRLQLPTMKTISIEIVRCRRLSTTCYECGAIFAT